MKNEFFDSHSFLLQPRQCSMQPVTTRLSFTREKERLHGMQSAAWCTRH